MVAAEKNMVLAGQISREDVETIKRAVAPDATDVELKQFLHLSVKYGLDPMAKEIYFTKIGGRPSIIVGRDGYLKTAMQDPDYDGLQSMVVKEGDHFEIDVENFKVIHRIGAKRGEILGAWAIARHKRRAPVVCFVDYKEYRQNKDIWNKYPSAMIQKVAEVFVLRRQFNISGLVSHEEIGMPEEARFGSGPAIDNEQGPVQVDVQDAAGNTVAQTTASPKAQTATETLQDMRATNEAFAQHMRERGALPPEQQPAGTPGAESEPQQPIPGQEVFPPSDDPVAPTEAQVKALTKAWDLLGVAKDRRDAFLSQPRPWAAWESAIATVEKRVAGQANERWRGETLADILQTAQQKKISAPGIARVLWPDQQFQKLGDLNDKQLAELLRKVKEA